MNENLSFFKVKDFNELNKRKVIIFGGAKGGSAINDILLRNNIEEKNILFFCDNNSNLWGNTYKEKKVISPIELKEYCECHKKVIIIVSTIVKQFYVQILNQLKELNIENTIILHEEIVLLERALFSIQNLEELEEVAICKKILLEEVNITFRHNFYTKLLEKNLSKNYQFVSIFLPTKTGSNTIFVSLPFGYPSSKLHTTFWMSKEDRINYKKCVKKIIIGVREAISQNISLVYQLKSGNSEIKTGKLWTWINPQEVFDYYIIDSILNFEKRRNENRYGFEEEQGYPMLIQSWFEDELEAGLNINIFDYPFDKKTGYQIIKVDEYEILVYRLESMNSLEEVFGEFLNIKDFKFARDNEASSKWYNESYRNFLKNVTMPQKYIDISYNSKYMKHFYTEEEISKFREKWEKHVDPNWSIQGE